jgi:hypothetical protein
MSLKFKGEVAHKINSSTEQKQKRPNGCCRVKKHMKFNQRFLFFLWRWKESESQHSAGDFSVPAPAGRHLYKRNSTQ